MAGRRRPNRVQDKKDIHDFDDEFEKFMNEPMSDDSHSVPSTIKKNLHQLEHSETMESIQNISDDHPIPDVQSYERSHSPVRRRQYDLIQEEKDEGDLLESEDTRLEAPLYGEDSHKYAKRGAEDHPGISKDSLELEKIDESHTLTMTAGRTDDSMAELRGYGEQTLQGLDTLEEMTDKEKFFSNLAIRASGTLDFSKLNKILDESLSDKEGIDDEAVAKIEESSSPDFDSKKNQESTVGKETQGQKEAIGEESDRSVEGVSADAMQTTGKDLENESQIAVDGERQKSEKDGDKLVNEDDSHPVDGSVIQLEQSDEDSDSPPPESLRRIKEIAKAKMEEIKQRSKSYDVQRNKKAQKNKSTTLKERESRSIRPRSELPSSKISNTERELQLLDELHRLRTNFNRVLDENEDLRKECYEGRAAVPTEKEMKFRYETELEQLQLKIITLEKQLKSGKECNRSEDDADTLKPEVAGKITQLEREVKAQEALLKGYQLENERLYKEMKKKDNDRKRLESNLPEENRKLRSHLAEKELKCEELELQLKEARRMDIPVALQKQNERQFTDPEAENERTKELQAENSVLRREIADCKEKMINDNKIRMDLERQNNEKEKIISRRYPDAVSALLQGKIPKPGQNLLGKDQSTQTVAPKAAQQSIPQPIPKSSTHDFLNRSFEVSGAQKFLNEKLKRLERELEMKDNETNRMLIKFEARYQDMGKRYEEHINVLQNQLHDASTKLKSHKKKLKEQELAMDILLRDRKDHGIDADPAAVREFIPPKRKAAKQLNGDSTKLKSDCKEIIATAVDSDTHSFVEHAAIAHHKCELENISLLKKNTDLKVALDDLQNRYEEQRERQIADVAKFEMKCSQIRSNAEAEMENLNIKHNREMEQKQAEESANEILVNKLRNDIDRMQRKIEDQDLIVRKLNEKVLQSIVDRELLQASKLKQDVLQNQIKLLEKRFTDERNSQPPDTLQFRSLEIKLSNMHQRQIEREGELLKILKSTRPTPQAENEINEATWRKIVDSKNIQIREFRDELDSILDILKQLYATGSFSSPAKRNLFK